MFREFCSVYYIMFGVFGILRRCFVSQQKKVLYMGFIGKIDWNEEAFPVLGD